MMHHSLKGYVRHLLFGGPAALGTGTQSEAVFQQPYVCPHTFAPAGQIERVGTNYAALAATIERFGSRHLTLHVSGRTTIEPKQHLYAHFIIGTQGPIRLRMVALHIEQLGVHPELGHTTLRVVARLHRPTRRTLAALGQYALQFARAHATLPKPRAIIDDGLGIISVGESLQFERPQPHEHAKLSEIGALRCRAYSQYDTYNHPERMLDDWDTKPGAGRIVVARLRGKIIGTIRNAYPHGDEGQLPLLSYMPHLRGKLPRGKLAEISRKAGDTNFWWGDMFPHMFAQLMLDGVAAGCDTIVASVLIPEVSRYCKMGFVDTKLRGLYPFKTPRTCGVIAINLADLWRGRLGFTAWRMLAAAAEDELPKASRARFTARDHMRLFLYRRILRLMPTISPPAASSLKSRSQTTGAGLRSSARA